MRMRRRKGRNELGGTIHQNTILRRNTEDPGASTIGAILAEPAAEPHETALAPRSPGRAHREYETESSSVATSDQKGPDRPHNGSERATYRPFARSSSSPGDFSHRSTLDRHPLEE